MPESFFILPGRAFSPFQRYRNRGNGDACNGTDGYYGDDHFLHKKFLLLMLQYRQIFLFINSIADTEPL